MRRSRKLGELAQRVFKDLVVVPTAFPPCVSERACECNGNGKNGTTTVLCKLQRARRDLLEQVPIGLVCRGPSRKKTKTFISVS